MIFLAQRALRILEVVRRAGDADAVDRRQHHTAAQHDDVRRLERVLGHIGELAAHAAQAQVRHGAELGRLAGVGEHHHGRARQLFRRGREPAVQSCAARVELRAHERARLDPAALRKPQSRRRHRHARMLACFLARHELRIIGRQAGDRRALRSNLLVVARELQHAAAVVLDAGQPLPVRERVQERGARKPREDAVVGREHRVKGAREVTGGFLRRLGVSLVELHLPAARAEPLAHRRPGDPGADDDRAPCGRRKMVTITIFFAADQHLALAAESRPLLHREAGRLQRLAHGRSDAPGRERRAGRREPRERAHHRVGPHLRILRRREAVEIDRIRARAQVP